MLTPLAPVLASLSEDASDPAGQSVASMLGSSLADLDADPLTGMALSGTSGSHGRWQYSLNNGSNWTDVGTVTQDAALLLRASDKLRWLPDGSLPTQATLSYLGWDQSSGTAGNKVSVASRGGSTAFSIDGDVASLTVTAINDAPCFVAGDGKLTTDIGASENFGSAILVQADGTILVAGSSGPSGQNDFALLRYLTSGSLDASFGTSGVVLTPVGPSNDTASAMVRQADGKILVAGSASNGNNTDFALVRYLTDGSLDTSFGSAGKVITSLGIYNDMARRVAIQSDGKLVVVGQTSNGSNDDVALVRYLANGSLDTSFGNAGKATTAIGIGNDSANSLTFQPDGKILVAGTTYNNGQPDFALLRYNTSGSLDTSFGNAGKVTTDLASSGSDDARHVLLQADGKIVVIGGAPNPSFHDFALVRYSANGSLDTSFGVGGKVLTGFGSSNDSAADALIQPDGKILLIGYANGYGGTTADLALARYLSNGSLDASFGTGGKVVTSINAGDDFGVSLALQPDGKIVLTGYGSNGNNNDILLARYHADGVLDTSFDASFLPLTAPPQSVIYTEDGGASVLQRSALIADVELEDAGSYAGASLTLSRQGGRRRTCSAERRG